MWGMTLIRPLHIKASSDRKEAIILGSNFARSFVNGGWVKRVAFSQEQIAGFDEVDDYSYRQILAASSAVELERTIHLIAFSDACPTDFLSKDVNSKDWHTIVFSVMQIKDAPTRLEDGSMNVDKILKDEFYLEYFESFSRKNFHLRMQKPYCCI